MSQSSTLFIGMDVHKDRSRSPMWRKIMAPRSPISAALAPASVTLINSSARCNPRPSISSLSMKPVPVATGSIGL